MSIAENPLMGPMSGSMGNFTTMNYHGRNIVRSKAFQKKDPKSDKQLARRMQMKQLADAYKSFGGMTNLGFIENTKGNAPYNLYIAANFSKAFIITDDVPEISYPLLQVSNGSIPASKVTEVLVNTEGITIRFITYIGLPFISAEDEMIAFARLKTGQLLIERQPRGIEETGTIVLKYPNLNKEEVECCYLFARSRDGKKASKSVYVKVKD
jgi:hypothetical protein